MATRPTRTVWRRLATLTVLIAGLLLVGAAAAWAQEPDGEEVYLANCAQCHQPDGGGSPGLFPPLKGNDNVQDSEYVRGVVLNGLSGEIVVNGEAYDGVMPGLPSLTGAEVDAVIAFIQTDLQVMDAPTVTTLAPTEEDEVVLEFEEAAITGQALFGGSEPLQNGGLACISCHTAGPFQGLFGPTMGPALADAAVTFGGEAGLRDLLAEPHAERMATLYDDRPLTTEERAELAAFLVRETGRTRQGGIPDGLVLMGFGGLLLLVGYAFLFGQRREGSQ